VQRDGKGAAGTAHLGCGRWMEGTGEAQPCCRRLARPPHSRCHHGCAWPCRRCNPLRAGAWGAPQRHRQRQAGGACWCVVCVVSAVPSVLCGGGAGAAHQRQVPVGGGSNPRLWRWPRAQGTQRTGQAAACVRAKRVASPFGGSIFHTPSTGTGWGGRECGGGVEAFPVQPPMACWRWRPAVLRWAA